MEHHGRTRGFVTIAAGSSHYFRLARNLLRSYRRFGKEQLPFALICDKVCDEAREFDDVVVMDKAYRSYMDKLQLIRYSPYDETIFVDADSLFLQDPGVLWEDFSRMGDFSGYGSAVGLDEDGWFFHKEAGEFSAALTFNVRMHGGLYYFRNTARGQEVFQRAMYLVDNYQNYRFAHFTEPADEPVLALSMAVSGCEPCPAENRICFVPALPKTPMVSVEGAVTVKGQPVEPVILHFCTAHTRRFAYTYLAHVFCGGRKTLPTYWKLKLRCLPQDLKVSLTRVLRKFLKDHTSPEMFKKIRMFLKDAKRKRK